MIDRLPNFLRQIRSAVTDNYLFHSHSEQSVKLEKKWIEKWDRDLRTIASLHTYAQSKGRVIALQGGMAVEAHCGGHLTRPHGDVDTVFYMHPTQPIDHDQDRLEIYALLRQEKDTKWLPSQGNKLDFRENVKNKPWDERRRLEVNLADYPVGERIQTMSLVNSKNVTQTVTVEHIDVLVANKTRIMLNNIGKTGIARATKEHDYSDLKRLMMQTHFNRNHCLSILQNYYINRESMSMEEASKKATEVLEKIESIIR